MRAPPPTPQSHLAHDQRLGFDTGKACRYCASSHHPIELCHLRIADIKMGLETTCEYTNCEDNKAHRIDARTFLHARGSQCKLRGHHSTQGATATPEFWRAGFEQFASKDKFNAQRGWFPTWGFHNLPQDLLPEPGVYFTLMASSHNAALATLYAV
jgi:hypothetical protein